MLCVYVYIARPIETIMIMMPSGGSWKKVDRSDQSSTSTSSQGSRKWITSSSIDDHTATNSTIAPKFEQEDDEKKQLSSPSPTYNRCNNNTCCICSDHINYNHIGVIRVCADCHTTKTPLWRSGPTGPKVEYYIYTSILAFTN